jgi:hypothetical protein
MIQCKDCRYWQVLRGNERGKCTGVPTMEPGKKMFYAVSLYGKGAELITLPTFGCALGDRVIGAK